MRILFTVHGYKPAYQVGGPIISVSSLAEALVRKGHSVTVFTTTCNMSEELDVPVDCPQEVEGVEVWYFRRQELLKKLFPFVSYISKSMGFLYSPAMAGQLDRIVPTMDLLHTHLPFIYPTFAAARAARKHQKPLFYHQRGVFDPGRMGFRSLKKQLFLKAIEQPILKSATSLIALTDAEVDSYRMLCPSVPCRIIPNGIDVELYRSGTANPDVLNISPEATVILFLGRLHPFKGADTLVEAFIQASTHIPSAVLVMAGPDEFNLGYRLRSMAQQHGLQDRIVFPGMVTGKTKSDLLARASLFCLPSVGEGFSMAILEALASETAVMISPGCHFPEVEQAGAGRVVVAEPRAMAESMIELLKDKAELRFMGRKGRELVEQNYSWDKIADEHLEVYREGLDRHSSTSCS